MLLCLIRATKNGQSDFYRFTARTFKLLHMSRWWLTIAQNLWLRSDYLQMQRRVPIIAGTYGSGPSSSDHLWRAGVPWKQPFPEESPVPAQSVLTKFKAPMQGSDFDEALTSVNPGLRRMSSSWFRGSRTTGARSEGSYHFSGGSSTSARGRVIAQARAWKAAAVDAAAKAARAGALRAYTHTHIHSLCRRRQSVQVTCLAGALAFTARLCARAFTEHSLSLGWGRRRGGVAGPKRGKPRTRTRIWRRFRKAQVRYAYVIYWQMHIYGTILHIYCISDLLFIVSIFIAYCLYVHIYCILHIVHILHIYHILHVMYIVHIVHIYA